MNIHNLRVLFLFLCLVEHSAVAAISCKAYPKSEWANQDELRTVLNEEGFTIKELKIDNHCYEMYGINKQGKNVEIYFDMKSLAIIAAEIEK